MTDTTPNTLPEEYRDPERYRLLPNGAIYDMQIKRIVANPGGGTFAITPETSAAMHQRRRELGLISHLRGLAKGAGIQLAPDAPLDEIVLGAANGLEALVAHMAQTFKESKNLRGMGESFGKLAAPLLGNLSEIDEPPPRTPMPRIILLLAQLRERQEFIEGQEVLEPAIDRGVKITKGD